MGTMSKTVVETMTDKLAMRLQTITDALPNTLITNTNGGFASYLDTASSDADLQAALLASSVDADREALAANYYTMLSEALGNRKERALANALMNYPVTTEGGGSESFPAYLTSVGATLHPLVAELFRSQIGQTSVTTVMHPKMDAVDFDAVHTGTMAALVDDTTDASDVGAADVDLFTSDDDVLVLQSRHRFTQILIELSTLASSDVAWTARYWNGNAWTALSLTDYTTGLSANGGLITFTRPSDWVPSNTDLNGDPINSDLEAELYTVILQRTEDTVATPPVATWIRTIPEAITLSDGTSLYGVDQPPIALVRITAANTCEVTVVQQPDAGRFACPTVGNSELKLIAVTSFTNPRTFTLGYTDQDGNAATKAQTSWASGAAGDTKTLALDEGDTGVQTIDADTCAITTDDTTGVFLVVANDYSRSIAAK